MPFDPETLPAVIAARAAKQTTLVPLGGPAPWPDDAAVAASGKCYPPPRETSDGSWFGTRMIMAEAKREVVWVGPTRRAIAFPYGWDPKAGARLSPSGTRVLMAVTFGGRGHVVECPSDGLGDWTVIATGTVPDAQGHFRENVGAADYAGTDDLVAVICEAKDASSLSLLARTERGWREVSQVKAKAFTVTSRGRCVVTTGQKDATMYAALGDGMSAQLIKLGKLAAPHVFAYPADTRTHIYAHAGAGKDGQVLVAEEVAVAAKKLKPIKKGQLLAPRLPPGGQEPPAPDGFMQAAFGHDYRAKHHSALDRTAGGRVLVHSPATPLIVDGTTATPAASLRMLHPRAERAIAYEDGAYVDVDLITGARSAPIGRGDQAFFVTQGDRVFLAIVQGSVQFELYAETAPGIYGPPVATIALDGASAGPGSDGAIVLVREPSKDSPTGVTLHRLADDATSITHVAHLVLPGPVFGEGTLGAARKCGVARLISLKGQFVFEIPALP